jgi:hypothetical protein
MSELRRIGRVLVIVGTVAVAACSDDALAPRPRPATVLASQGVTASRSGDTTITVLDVWARRGGVFRIGEDHTVIFPASAICDPATSSYGRGEWDEPCTPAIGWVQIRAKSWRSADGHPAVQFEPALRFAPAAKVVLEVRDRTAAAVASGYSILTCDAQGCYDEAAVDASLATYRIASLGILYRRIKHFSGYNIALGFAQDDSASQEGAPNYSAN